jgi:hypothetical protein
LTTPWVILILADCELFLALWLFSGLHPRWSWGAALACFFGFFAVSLFRALGGERSCACFGPLELSPWLTTALDAGIVLLLASVQLPPSPHPTRQSHPRRFASAMFLGSAVAVAGLIGFLTSRASADVLVVSDPRLDFGELPQGSYQEKTFTVTNTSSLPVRLTAIESTCPCLTFQLEKSVLAAGEDARVVAQLNLGKEPDYVGRLGVDVVGGTDIKDVRFRLVITVRVIPATASD